MRFPVVLALFSECHPVRTVRGLRGVATRADRAQFAEESENDRESHLRYHHHRGGARVDQLLRRPFHANVQR